MSSWQRIKFDDGIEIEYQTRGAGERVVLVHHGADADWFAPLLEQPALANRFCLVHYHRAGYAGSSPLTAPLTFENEALMFSRFARRAAFSSRFLPSSGSEAICGSASVNDCCSSGSNMSSRSR